VEVLAASIHETWCALGKEGGWSMQPLSDKTYAELASRRDARKFHPRNSIRHYPNFAARAGCRIVPIVKCGLDSRIIPR
jgi:hypothetical protein